MKNDELMQNDELMHFGVLGMRWGVRRYQPYSVKPRGSGKGGKEIIKEIKRKAEEKRLSRQQKQEAKQKRNEMTNEHVAQFDKYKETPEGKKKFAKYQKAMTELYDTYGEDPKVLDRFNSAERDYLQSSGKFVASAMINKYGMNSLREFENISAKDMDELIKESAEMFYQVHRL